MAWGMVAPAGAGDFFPEGNYVGWKEAVKEYYDTKMSVAERASMGMQDGILYSNFAAKFNLDRGPLAPHEQPTEYRIPRRYKSLASMIELVSRLIAVDEPLKNIIESLEPGVHQFWPIRITMPKDEVYPTQYYGLVIRQFFDSFSPDQSSQGSWSLYEGRNGYRRYSAMNETKTGFSQLAMNSNVFGSAHLWRERFLSRPNIIFSDALQAKIAEAGLRIPKHLKLKAI